MHLTHSLSHSHKPYEYSSPYTDALCLDKAGVKFKRDESDLPALPKTRDEFLTKLKRESMKRAERSGDRDKALNRHSTLSLFG